MAKKLLFLCILTALTLVLTTNSFAGRPIKKINKELTEALQSSNPEKVNKCLDKIIEINYISGITKIRQYAKKMKRIERGKIIRDNQDNKNTIRWNPLRWLNIGKKDKAISAGQNIQKNIQENLAPWIDIEKKAKEYFVRKNVNQKGKEDPLFFYNNKENYKQIKPNAR